MISLKYLWSIILKVKTMFHDTIEDVKKLELLKGKTIKDIVLMGRVDKKWIKAISNNEADMIDANITIIFEDDTCIRGIDGEYGENTIYHCDLKGEK